VRILQHDTDIIPTKLVARYYMDTAGVGAYVSVDDCILSHQRAVQWEATFCGGPPGGVPSHADQASNEKSPNELFRSAY